MISKLFLRAALATSVAALTISGASADAHTCKRLTKTGGAAVGAVAGGALGAILTGGTTAGVLGGAAIGGIGGHEVARTKYNQHCRRYYRRGR